MPETAAQRSRSTAAKGDDMFTLSPPPTRRRSFIQMKKQPQESADAAGGGPRKQYTGVRSKQLFGQPKSISSGQGKKRLHGDSNVASRKATRKTAHRLVERRRRIKINEAFALLESLIPACAGNVHKLAILQSSVDYIRYLENCLAKLKAQLSVPDSLNRARRISPSSIGDFHEERSGNLALANSAIASPNTARWLSSSHQPFISPRSEAKDAINGPLPCSSVSSHRNHHDSSGLAVGALVVSNPPGRVPEPELTIPAWNISPELDHEAAASLLAFNAYRLCPAGVIRNRGLSVHDLCT